MVYVEAFVFQHIKNFPKIRVVDEFLVPSPYARRSFGFVIEPEHCVIDSKVIHIQFSLSLISNICRRLQSASWLYVEVLAALSGRRCGLFLLQFQADQNSLDQNFLVLGK